MADLASHLVGWRLIAADLASHPVGCQLMTDLASHLVGWKLTMAELVSHANAIIREKALLKSTGEHKEAHGT